MKLPRLLSMSSLFLLIFAATAHAEWWKPSMPRMPSMPSMPKMPSVPNLNPFTKRDSHPASISKQQEGWAPGMSRKSSEQPEDAGPSMWQKVSSGTKSTWTKTKSTLTPWRAKPQPKEEFVITGPNSSFHRMANHQNKQPVKKASWFWTDGEDEKPQKAGSVSEFIGGKRPQ